MSRYEAIALLDPPSTESFGMVGVVFQIWDEAVAPKDWKLRVTGLNPTYPSSLDRIELENLIAAGHVMRLVCDTHYRFWDDDLQGDPETVVALWRGGAFQTKAKAFGIQPEVSDRWARLGHIRDVVTRDDPRDSFRLTRAPEAFAALETYTKAVVQRAADLCRLARWTLPELAGAEMARLEIGKPDRWARKMVGSLLLCTCGHLQADHVLGACRGRCSPLDGANVPATHASFPCRCPGFLLCPPEKIGGST